MQQALEAVQSYLTITRVDKSESNFAFVCTRHYQQTIMQRLQSSDFAPVRRIPQATEHMLAESLWLKTLQLLGQTDTHTPKGFPRCGFPTMIGTVKQKKLTDPSKTLLERGTIDMWRWITAAQAYPVKLASHTHVRISKLIEKAYYSHCRKASIEARRHLPSDMKRKHRVKHYHQAKVVTHIIRNAPKRIKSVHNGDHSKMFERLPHKGPVSIIAACMHKARIAFDEASSDAIFIHMSTGHGVWSRDWVAQVPTLHMPVLTYKHTRPCWSSS